MTEFEAALLASIDELRQGQLRVHAELHAIREILQSIRELLQYASQAAWDVNGQPVARDAS